MLSYASARWLAFTVAECSLAEGRKNFLKMYCEGNKLLCAHRRANTFGCYLDVKNFEDSGRRGMLVTLEGEGWNSLASELKRTLPLSIPAHQAPQKGPTAG